MTLSSCLCPKDWGVYGGDVKERGWYASVAVLVDNFGPAVPEMDAPGEGLTEHDALCDAYRTLLDKIEAADLSAMSVEHRKACEDAVVDLRSHLRTEQERICEFVEMLTAETDDQLAPHIVAQCKAFTWTNVSEGVRFLRNLQDQARAPRGASAKVCLRINITLLRYRKESDDERTTRQTVFAAMNPRPEESTPSTDPLKETRMPDEKDNPIRRKLRQMSELAAEADRKEIMKTVSFMAVAGAVTEIAKQLKIDTPSMSLFLGVLVGDNTAAHTLWHAGRCQTVGRKLCNHYKNDKPMLFEFCGLDMGHAGDCDFDHEPESAEPPATPASAP